MADAETKTSQTSPAAIGMNHNVAVKGVVFHIQTEDLGPTMAQVVTHVFAEGGRVVKVARLDYSQHLNSPNLRYALPKVVRAHHQAVTRKLLAGALDSLPDLLVLRPSTEAETAQMMGKIAHKSRNAPAPTSILPSPVGEKKSKHAAIEGGNSARPKRSPASIWNLLVQDAHRMHGEEGRPFEQSRVETEAMSLRAPEVQGATLSPTEDRDMESAPPSSHSWDQAVRRARNVGQTPGRFSGDGATQDSDLSIAELSFNRGQKLLESRDLPGALSCFAHCVHLEPSSKRFRTALRRTLDLMDG